MESFIDILWDQLVEVTDKALMREYQKKRDAERIKSNKYGSSSGTTGGCYIMETAKKTSWLAAGMALIGGTVLATMKYR